MKANYHKLEMPIEKSFHIRKDIIDYFDDAWHFHDMLELVFIKKGKGERFIGDSIGSFDDGEVVLVGSKLPHVWKSKKPDKYHRNKCVAIVIQFPINFLGDYFLQLSESSQINSLFKKAERGIVFNSSVKKRLAKDIESLLRYNNMDRLIKFLNILQTAASTTEFELLASSHFNNTIFSKDVKINKAFEFIMDNFKEEVSLTEISSYVGMNKTSFCRYFKSKTKKTFSVFLNEIRIGYACKLIREDHIRISEAIYDSGFNSPSYFYKTFKKIKGISPIEYQESKP